VIYKIFPNYTILFSEEGNPSKKGIILFAHYDKHGFIDDYVVEYIKKLAELDADIIFISNSKKLKIEHLNKIKPYVFSVIHRWGRGRDFGSWYVGLKLYKEIILKKEFLVLCNDSVYGPFEKQEDINFFDKFYFILRKADFGGFTDSLEVKYHIQSYFLVFNSQVIKNQMFWDFWKKYKFFNHKRRVIRKYEIGLTQYLIKKGFVADAYCSYFRLLNLISRKYPYHPFYYHINYAPVNPTHFFWDILITEMGFPFIKIELLRDNPSQIPNIIKWQDILIQHTNAPIELYINHLKRVK